MDDYFATLGLRRRAALSAEEIRSSFQKLGATVHPDSAGADADKETRNADFSLLTTAQRALSSTARRLAHLVELETGSPLARGGTMREETMQLFLQTGPALQNAEAILTKKAAATTALAKALLEPELQSAQDEVERVSGLVLGALTSLENGLEELDRLKFSDADCYATQLATQAREVAFLEKWSAQLQQMMLRFLTS